MKANPDKFQTICLSKTANSAIQSFNICDTEIKCETNVNLFGVNIDFFAKIR
jgi:hypothetical protein